MKTEGPERNRPRSTRRLAAVTVAWLAAGGLLLVIWAATGYLRSAARPAAVAKRSETDWQTCWLCSRVIPHGERDVTTKVRAEFPGQRAGWNRGHFWVCRDCKGQLNPAGKQRALQNWIAAEVARLQANARETARPGGLDEFCQRLRQARLLRNEPDPNPDLP